jgi:hypothetical protein
LSPMRNATGTSICKVLKKLFMTYGAPKLLISDNARAYKSVEYKDLAKKHNTSLQYTPNYHAQANPSERVNRVAETIIRSHVSENQKDWDQYIPQIQFAINSSLHETTRLPPNFLFFGRQPSLYNYDAPRDDENLDLEDPVSQYAERFPKMKRIFQQVKEKIHESNQKNERHYNLRRRPHEYRIGDSSKFWAKFSSEIPLSKN